MLVSTQTSGVLIYRPKPNGYMYITTKPNQPVFSNRDDSLSAFMGPLQTLFPTKKKQVQKTVQAYQTSCLVIRYLRIHTSLNR